MGSKKPINSSKLSRYLDKAIKEDNIYIFSTRNGFYYISIIFVLFMISLTYGHSLALTGSFIFISIVMVSAFYTNFNLKGVYVERNISKRGYFHSSVIDLDFKLKNLSLVDRYDVQVELAGQESDDYYRLDKEGSYSLNIPMKGLERGAYRFKRLKLWTNFPFGIFFSWKYLKYDDSFYIYPNPKNYLKNQHHNDEQSYDDEEGKAFQKGDHDFYGHRSYREGDSWKHIDWKLYAKSDSLQVKEFASPIKQELVFDFEKVPLEDQEERLSQLCFWITEAHQQQSSYALKLPGFDSSIGDDKAHFENCLRELALFEKNEVLIS